MMPRYVMHLVHSADDGLWHLTHDDESLASFTTREEGEHAGEARSRIVVDEGGIAEFVIHDEDGAIEREHAYGDDDRGT